MRSRLLINLLLLLLAIGLGTFLFVDEIDQNGTYKLSNLATDSITRISIHHREREAILELQDQQWRMTKPVDIAANQFRIKTLLNLLGTSSHAQYKTDGLDLEKYGLDQTDTYVSFNDFKVVFGMVNPFNQLRYVMAGNELHLIDDHYYPLLSSQIGTLIARELLPADANISQLILPELTLSRTATGLWQSSIDLPSDAIVEAIYQWTHKQAFAVHDYVQRESLGEIQVYLENVAAPILFSITDVEPWLIIARPELNIEYHFNLEDYDALLRPGAARPLPDEAGNETIQVSPDDFMKTIQSE
jgi:hypothetical protein